VADSVRRPAPAKAAAPYVDFSTAVLSALGTLAALLHRARTGEGQQVATSLLGTALSVFASHLIEQDVTRRNRPGSGNRVQTSAPTSSRHATATCSSTWSATRCSDAGRG
jgi:crotonobetainyl-CoA:carnitine CoA-transferase CaiB-like acyl-CoA transferase